jgi:Peptidase family M28
MRHHLSSLRAWARPACAVAVAFAWCATASGQAVATPPTAAPAAAADGTALLATIQALTAPGMDGRAAGTPGNSAARAWILKRFAALGLEPADGGRFDMTFSFTSKAGAAIQGVNVVGQCRGRRPDLPVLVVSAHYDHLGIRDGQTYHGADDNASGVAMLLAVAERCVAAPFDHTLVLAALDAEEQGLQGGKAFVASPPVATDRIALNVNFDMVSRSDRREIYVAGPGRWPALLPLLKAPAARAPITVKFGHDTGGGQDDWTTQSDHGAFHAAGIPFVYFGVEDHADYHKPTDTADKIDPRFLGGVAAFVLDAIGGLDGAAGYR